MSNYSFSMPIFLEKVRDQKFIAREELRHFITHLDEFPDEQVSAFLAHAFHKPLSSENIVEMTLAMRDSGDVLHWPDHTVPVVDKHSTGGVGDKITICLAPLVAALGLRMPTISGRGLGHTGGTVDKLESIEGFSLNLGPDKLLKQVLKNGFAFGEQTAEIAPADARLYHMRDITACVPSMPLIVPSILSKKLAESLDALVLDVKCGSGAFMKTIEDARGLASMLVKTANGAGVKCSALITNMNQPLGLYSGNWCEIVEATRILRESESSLSDIRDVYDLTVEMAAELLLLSRLETTRASAIERVKTTLASGKAWDVFLQEVADQGGDIKSLSENPPKLLTTKHGMEFKAERSGTLTAINSQNLGQALVLARAGREKKSDSVSKSTSLYHPIKIGARLNSGDTICVLRTDHLEHETLIRSLINEAFVIEDKSATSTPLILETITH